MDTKLSKNHKSNRMFANIQSIFVILAITFSGGWFQARAAFPGENRKIAFMSNRDSNFEIYVMESDGSNQTNLTNNPAYDGYPSWSPDGSQIVFSSERDGNYEIYSMNADGTDPTRLTADPSTDVFPSWSPDGSQIVFARYDLSIGNYDIWRMNSDGTGAVQLTDNPTEDMEPVWSPDGTKILFHSDRDGNVEIYVMNSDGTNQTNFTNDPAADGQADWSPDGSKIAFASTRDGFGALWVMNADGSSPTRLTDAVYGDGHLSWSPDGTKIVFKGYRDFNDEIYVMNADGTNVTRLTNNAPPGNTLPEDWFPDWQPSSVVAMTYVVNTTNDDDDGACDESHCSLREAINAANANPAADTIAFNVPGDSPFTIQPGSALPNIYEPVTIDGTTQPGFEGSPVIELDGSNAGEGVTGLVVTAGFSTVQGLVINRFSGSGIGLVNGGENTIRGNFIGTDVTGMTALGNGDGIWLGEGTSNNVIGGTTTETRNIISGNNIFGVSINHENVLGNLLLGNYIGTDVNGTGAIPNAAGGVVLALGTSLNQIGGTEPGAGNLISGNSGDGVTMVDGTSGNIVKGNFIGTDKTGTAALGNWGRGILIAGGSTDNLVGGMEASAGNLVSGNGAAGIRIMDVGTTGNKVQGNFIGTDITGISPLGNGYVGVRVSDGAANTQIGGTEEGAGNLISSNKDSGVLIDGNETTGNVVQGNYIGIDVTGTMITGPAGPAFGEFTLTVEVACPTYPVETNFDGFVSESEDPLAPWSGISVTFKGTEECGSPEMLGEASLIYRYKLVFDDVTQLTSIAVSGAAFNGPDNVLRVLDENMNVLGSVNTFGGNSFKTPYITLQDVVGKVFYVDEFDTSGGWRFRKSFVVNGMLPLGNQGSGVVICCGAAGNTVGGDSDAARNIVSGNAGDGIGIFDPGTNGNAVQGNFIGTDMTGTMALGNSLRGVFIASGPASNWIGGSATGEGNLVSGNGFSGVDIADAHSNWVQGNRIGTNIDGTASLGNYAFGVVVDVGATGNVIGGANPGARNLISGNSASGVWIFHTGTTGNTVQGNYIGTDLTGTQPLGNAALGVEIGDQASDNLIIGNLISGNRSDGLGIFHSGTSGNTVQDNFIGTDVTGTTTTGPAGPVVGEYTLTVMPETCPTYPAGTDFDGFVSESDDPLAPWSETSVTFKGTDECTDRDMIGAASLVYRYKLEFAATTQLSSIMVAGAAFNGPDSVLRVLDNDMHVLATAYTFGGNSFQTPYITLQGVEGTTFYIDEFDTSSTWRFRQSIIVNGPVPLGNYGNGVLIANSAFGNMVDGNVISGNSQNGVGLFNPGTSSNVVQENYIGTDITGTQSLGNFAPGVGIGDQAFDNLIIGNLISGNRSTGVSIFNSGTIGNSLQGNYIGTDANGTTTLPNTSGGVWIGDGASNTLIGGASEGEGNIISGNTGDAISINDSGTTGIVIQGNYIGTDSTGTAPLPNMSNGIVLVNGTHDNLIGGAESGAGNIISANFGSGVGIFNPGTTGNTVQGNYIGTDVTGTTTNGPAGMPVGEPTVTVMEACPTYPAGTDIDGFVSESEDPLEPWSGVSVHFQGTEAGCGSPEMIGAASLIYRYKLEFADVTPLESISVSGAAFNGPDSVLRVLDEGMNVIGTTNTFGGNSFLTQYVRLQGVEGKVFYLDEFDTSSSWRFRQSIVINGPLPLGNRGNGVAIGDGASSNLLIENLISGNMSDGVGVSDPGTTDNILRGNFIGTDANGTSALPNSGVGVWIGGADDTIIGGAEEGEGNLISGNAVHGVSINFLETTGTQVLGNYIGTNRSGDAALPNGAGGVFVSASQTWIGGTEPGAGNLISGNTGFGVDFQEAATGNFTQGNFIGTDASGALSLGNSFSGINLGSGAADNSIGGTDPGAGNTIAFNEGRGIRAIAESGLGNAMLSNSVFSNGLLGIDLNADGITLNDPLDQDTGPNNLQNYPVIISVMRKGGSVMMNGLLVSTPGTTFRLEFFSNDTCDPSGYGEGQTFLGYATVTTNPVGIGNFKTTLPVSLPQGAFVTVTATDAGGNTSEFSKCVGPVK